MTDVSVKGLSKSFGKVPVLDAVDLEVASGEFLAVLGPSGCGKTTLLRLLAGFEAPSAGEITLGGAQVAGQGVMVPPEDRGVGIVFQSYALWPHMTVAENVGYALKVAKLPRAERDARVLQALKTVDLQTFAERRPADLSGGQRQRVALARCLAARSNLVLLDEPLANLDVHLRATMEEEFRRFHRESGATLVYITHDQSEAMALADRIAVMDKGKLLQCASPQQLYREPASAMVASFIGDGLLLPAEDVRPTGPGRVQARIFGVNLQMRAALGQGASPFGLVSCHPGDLRLLANDGSVSAQSDLPVRVAGRVYRGGSWSYDLRPDADPSLMLSVDLPDQGAFLPRIGDSARVRFDDLWLIPNGAAASAASSSVSDPSRAKKVLQCA